jgi:hypothetical protein
MLPKYDECAGSAASEISVYFNVDVVRSGIRVANATYDVSDGAGHDPFGSFEPKSQVPAMTT